MDQLTTKNIRIVTISKEIGKFNKPNFWQIIEILAINFGKIMKI